MSEFTVAISSDFFSAFASLPKTKQGKVMDFMSKFRSNPTSPGLNYEKINDAYDKNMRSGIRRRWSRRALPLSPRRHFLTTACFAAWTF